MDRSGFTLVEMMVAFTITAVIMVMLLSAMEPVSNAWIEGERRIETHQRARGALELMARELTPAVVDTRMQFVMLPGELLEDSGANYVAENSPAIIWMAPVGPNGELRCVGYYLYRDDYRKFFRLKRIYVSPLENEDYYPKLVDRRDARNLMMRTDPTSASWFTETWDSTAFDEEDPYNDDAIVSTAADGVIGLWFQPFDLLGNPIPWVSKSDVHLSTELIYNSASYFQVATTEPFDNGESFAYLADTQMVMKGNRVPAEIEITLVTIDKVTLERDLEMPQIENEFHSNGSLDAEESVQLFLEELKSRGIHRAEVFTTRVKLVNGSG
ncbi:MAG: prepilin-type N-terminal cleavage/methylation domain-containing protein [Verrucomicrobiales bacterium]|nr:prepilin-type N-terminal cleavage/methylation domain-containing protein [Verrucomicrobiales bacterium]